MSSQGSKEDSSVGVVEGEVSWALQEPGVLTATRNDENTFEKPLKELTVDNMPLESSTKKSIPNTHFILFMLFAAFQLIILIAVLKSHHKRTAMGILDASKEQLQLLQQQQEKLLQQQQLLEQQLRHQEQQQEQQLQLQEQLELQHKMQEEQQDQLHHQHVLLHGLQQQQQKQQLQFQHLLRLQEMMVPDDVMADPSKLTVAFFRLHLETIWKAWVNASDHFLNTVFAISKTAEAGSFEERVDEQAQLIRQFEEAASNMKDAAKALSKAKRFWETAAKDQKLLSNRQGGDEEASVTLFFLDRVSSAQKYALHYLDWVFKRHLYAEEGSSSAKEAAASGGSLSFAAFLEASRQAQALKPFLPKEFQAIQFLGGPLEWYISSQEATSRKMIPRNSPESSPEWSPDVSPLPVERSPSSSIRSPPGPAQRYLRRKSSSPRANSPPPKVTPSPEGKAKNRKSHDY